MKVPLFKQNSKLSCGPTALRMVFAYFEKNISEREIVKGLGGLRSMECEQFKWPNSLKI